MRDRRGVTRLGVVVGLALATVAAGYGASALGGVSEKAHRSRCFNNQRQLAIAAIQHADDTRWYPHVRAREELDGGVETSDAPRALRSLVLAGYHDLPQGFVCPSSSDEAVPGATWWRSDDERTAPTLASTREVSYGWTRRALNSNVRSTTPIAADRAVRHDDFDDDGVTSDDPLQGNHVGGLGVAQADGSIMWWSTTDGDAGTRETLAALAGVDGPREGALAIVPPLHPRRPQARGWFGHLGADALALVPLGLAGAVFLLSRPPAPPRAPRPPRPARRRPDSGRVAPLADAAAAEVQAEQRCPYCHDALVTPEVAVALTSCSGCRTVFHADCVPEDGACTTLGCDARPA